MAPSGALSGGTPARRPVVAGRGVVSSGNPLAASAAMQQLMSGGNAVDAILAASAVQCVVEMPWCSLGGDLFLSVYTPGSGVETLNGAGRAPARIEELFGPGEKVPRYGAASVAVPGLPQAWDLACQRFASRPLSELLAPAIRYAAAGFPLYGRLSTALGKLASSKDVGPALSELVRKTNLSVGSAFKQPELAASLELVAGSGSRAFYRGPLAQRLTAAVAARGGVLSESDLAAHNASWSDPVHVPYRGFDVFEHPLTSLGCVLLEELRILEGFDVPALEPGSAELIDLLVKCKEAAFADSSRLGDPEFVADRVAEILSDERVHYWQEQLSGTARPRAAGLLPAGLDTTSTVVADRDGNVACLIQSLFNEFGSRELVAGTGILLNDRLANMVNDPASPNGLRGGKRPLHTLNTYIVCRDGEPVLAGATPGGRGQVQINLQILVDILDFKMNIQEAVEAPRWISGGAYRGLTDNALYAEPSFSSGTVAGLRAAGRAVETAAAAEPDLFGNCTVVARDPFTGALQAAADPRRDGMAAGW
ncbi:MAG TPA: gamma-glutamyltransferase family protein [Dehalococcoidia bacterium]|nr:gamma-glutamyltransferase family protein [Dehalococcoidia bacterium]